MNSSKEIQAIAREMSARMQWYQEMGIDTWVEYAQEEHSDPPRETPSLSGSLLSLEMIREEIGDCQRCKLSSTRIQIVFGYGSQKADLLFVGEGPGRDEDLQGEPFVGRAGQLLTKMIEAMGLSRQTVYIANIIKCRPPHNRNPEQDEITSCRPFLEKQIAAIRPKVICALGSFAAQTLLNTERRISELRGRFHDLDGLKVLPTFHPAYLLRNPSQKIRVWEDLQKIMVEMGLPPAKPSGGKG